MIDKQAEIAKRARLYFACRAVYRVKCGSHRMPKPNRFMEKQSFYVNPIGIATGGFTGGTLGYQGGNWLANQFNLAEDDWRAKALRWGGGALGAVGGAVVGNFAGPIANKVLGWGGKALGAAGRFLGFGRNAAQAANAAKTVAQGANAAKTVAQGANAAKNVTQAANTAKNVAQGTNTAAKVVSQRAKNMSKRQRRAAAKQQAAQAQQQAATAATQQATTAATQQAANPTFLSNLGNGFKKMLPGMVPGMVTTGVNMLFGGRQQQPQQQMQQPQMPMQQPDQQMTLQNRLTQYQQANY